jgi:hypothetical protein
MYMSSQLIIKLCVYLSLTIGFPASAQTLGGGIRTVLGEENPNYVSSIVSPDGSGLPRGSGTAIEGAKIYREKCASCHGKDGEQMGNQLVGGQESLASSRPLKTVGSYWPYATTLFDYIARAMPFDKSKSLTSNETYALSAYILVLNGILKDNAILDERSLPQVIMPNSEGFVENIH